MTGSSYAVTLQLHEVEVHNSDTHNSSEENYMLVFVINRNYSANDKKVCFFSKMLQFSG